MAPNARPMSRGWCRKQREAEAVGSDLGATFAPWWRGVYACVSVSQQTRGFLFGNVESSDSDIGVCLSGRHCSLNREDLPPRLP